MAVVLCAVGNSAAGRRPLSTTATDNVGTRRNKLTVSMVPLNPPPTTTTLYVRFINGLLSPASRPSARCGDRVLLPSWSKGDKNALLVGMFKVTPTLPRPRFAGLVSLPVDAVES